MRGTLLAALIAASSVFAACNAQPATDEEMAELESQEAALEGDEGAEASDESTSDETAAVAPVDDDNPRNAYAEPDDPDKIDEAVVEEAAAAAVATPTPAAAPMQLTASGARGAALQLGTSSTVTAPTVQLRVGHTTPSSSALRPQLQPTRSLQLDLGANGATGTTNR